MSQPTNTSRERHPGTIWAGTNPWPVGRPGRPAQALHPAGVEFRPVRNPFAGIATGSSWLPAPAALIGQLLPPGAAGTLVRSVAYLGGAGGGTAAITLGAWVAGGLVLWFAGPRLTAWSAARRADAEVVDAEVVDAEPELAGASS